MKETTMDKNTRIIVNETNVTGLGIDPNTTHITADGRVLRINEMTLEHLKNTVNLLWKNAQKIKEKDLKLISDMSQQLVGTSHPKILRALDYLTETIHDVNYQELLETNSVKYNNMRKEIDERHKAMRSSLNILKEPN